MLSQNQQISKRLFDIVLSVLGIFFLTIPILILTIFASISTKKTVYLNKNELANTQNHFKY